MITRGNTRPRPDSDLAMIFLRGCILVSLVLEADSFSPAATAAVGALRPASALSGPRGVLGSRYESGGGSSKSRCCIACRRGTHGAPDRRRRAVWREAGRLRSCVTIVSSTIDREHDHAIGSPKAAPEHELHLDSRGAAAGKTRERRKPVRQQRIGQGLGEGGMTRGQLVQLGFGAAAAVVLVGGSGIASAAAAEVCAATSSAICDDSVGVFCSVCRDREREWKT